jgi:hypothetical protein
MSEATKTQSEKSTPNPLVPHMNMNGMAQQLNFHNTFRIQAGSHGETAKQPQTHF